MQKNQSFKLQFLIFVRWPDLNLMIPTPRKELKPLLHHKHNMVSLKLTRLSSRLFEVFYMPNLGECHIMSPRYYRHGKGRCKDRIGTDRNDCNGRKFCAGRALRNMVYKIVGELG